MQTGIAKDDFPKHAQILSKYIYAGDTSINGYTFKYFDDKYLTAEHCSDISHTAQWGKNWLVSFNKTKTKLVTVHHHSADVKSAPILICSHTHKKAPCLERLLGLKLTSDHKRNAYIPVITKDAGKIICSLYRSRKYLIPVVMVYLYKSHIRQRMKYY